MRTLYLVFFGIAVGLAIGTVYAVVMQSGFVFLYGFGAVVFATIASGGLIRGKKPTHQVTSLRSL